MKDIQLTTRAFLLLLLDIMMIFISAIGALWLRYEMNFNIIDTVFLNSVINYAPINIIITVLVF